MGRTACTEPQCPYNGALYLYLLVPWSRKSRAIPLLPIWAGRPVQSLSACTTVTFTFTSEKYPAIHGTGRWLRWYYKSLRGGRSGDRIPVRSEIFRTRLDRPWGPPNFLYNVNRVIPGKKRPKRGVDHPPLYLRGWRKSTAIPVLPQFAFCPL